MNNPRIISSFPKNQEINVSPNIKEIIIQFNKPMKKSYAFISEYEEMDFRNGFWKNNTSFYLRINKVLKPKKEYIIYLNGYNKLFFRDIDNNPLLPTTLIFKTR